MINTICHLRAYQVLLSRVLAGLVMIAALAPFYSSATENESLGEKAGALNYKCEIVSVYSRLHTISTGYGEILINEDEAVIYYASTEAGLAFDEVRKELRGMYVPSELKDPHDMLLKAVSTYIESARSIEKALGIFIGVIEGSEDETLKLVNQGERQVVLANKYLSQSLDMHDKLLTFEQDDSKSCRKYVAGL